MLLQQVLSFADIGTQLAVESRIANLRHQFQRPVEVLARLGWLMTHEMHDADKPESPCFPAVDSLFGGYREGSLEAVECQRIVARDEMNLAARHQCIDGKNLEAGSIELLQRPLVVLQRGSTVAHVGIDPCDAEQRAAFPDGVAHRFQPRQRFVELAQRRLIIAAPDFQASLRYLRNGLFASVPETRPKRLGAIQAGLRVSQPAQIGVHVPLQELRLGLAS